MVRYDKEAIKNIQIFDDNLFAISREGDQSFDIRYISDLKYKGNL